MAIIEADFPQSRQARKAKLEEILEDHRPISSVKAPWRSYMIGDLLVTINEDNSQ